MIFDRRRERRQRRRLGLRDADTRAQPTDIAAQHQARAAPTATVRCAACGPAGATALPTSAATPTGSRPYLPDSAAVAATAASSSVAFAGARGGERGFERGGGRFDLRRLTRRSPRRPDRAARCARHASAPRRAAERALQRARIEVAVRRRGARAAPGLVTGRDRLAQLRWELLERRHRARHVIDRGHDLGLLLGRHRRLVAIALARRQPAPHDLAREAQLIEPLRIVAVQARRQDLALPRAGGGLEALQLLEHAAEPVGADQLRATRDALPPQQEPHQRRRAHRLDLAAQLRERQAMDAREHAAVAPLERIETAVGGARIAAFTVRCDDRIGLAERAAQDRAVGFEREQRAEHVGERQAELERELARASPGRDDRDARR